MTSLDQLKQEIKEEASNNPDKFFATDILHEKDFHRDQCTNCGMYFWSYNEEREVCGEPECSNGYTFINNSPTEETFSYAEAWETFKEHMTNRGYKAIDRYPVVARWRDDTEFVEGSIYNFQPHVVSGEAEPPAPELIVPQPSLRFNDVENVGITGRHYVLHNHIGQTCFQPPEKYDQDRYFKDMFEFATKKLGIPKDKLILHEDCWGGGGNLGACMEFFVDGLELWNQVYMFYKQTPGSYEELDLKVLDMGMGHERITWISHGTETSYECVMPETLDKMKDRVGLEVDEEIWEKFLPHSSELNIDEVEDIDRKWREIAEEIDEDVDELKDEIKPAAALYSVAEHARALIFALADGKIPSNTGGGHNLRMIYRRSQDFIERYNWNLDLVEVAEWNAKELKPLFPELIESMDEIEEILNVENIKYKKSRKKALEKLDELEKEPDLKKMIELYESHGVSPEMMEERGFKVPEDFYSQISEEEEVVKEIEEKFDLEDVEKTEKLYYQKEEPYRNNGDVDHFDFKAEIVKIIEDNWIVLNRTMFYPQGGGQKHDVGKINGHQVTDVQSQAGVVLHKAPEHKLEEGRTVKGVVNGKKRKQLTQHHSTTHMVNAAAREKLGEHIYQAGAKKDLQKGRLDITHYEKPTKNTVREIETAVKEIIEEDHNINVKKTSKSKAEQKYGFRIYQGGAPPGNTIRLIEIEDKDIEACGGTHLTTTSHAEDFYITNTKRIQDGVIRLEYKSGEAARKFREETNKIVEECIEELEKASTKDSLKHSKDARETQENLSTIFSVDRNNLTKTVKRFREETQNKKETVKKLSNFLDLKYKELRIEGEKIEEVAQSLFEARKELDKTITELESEIKKYIEQKAQTQDKVKEEVPTENIGLLIQISREFANRYNTTITLIGEKGAISASPQEKAIEELEEITEGEIQGNKEFAKTFDLKNK